MTKYLLYLISLVFLGSFAKMGFGQSIDSTVLKTDTVKLDSLKNDTLSPAEVKKEKPIEVQKVEEAYDTIFKKSGFAILCKVKDKNLFEIKYIKKGEKLERKISTRELKSISYANGKTELIDNNPQKSKKDWVTTSSEIEWKRVKTFKDPAEVAGMTEKGDIEAEYVASKMTMGNDVMERNAIAILQKKALTLKGNAILILTKEIKREYGEIPSIKMTAKAYSRE